MKIMRNLGYCKITFEENECYAGKKLRVEGDRLENGFGFYPTTFAWYGKNEEGKTTLSPVEADLKDELSNYVIDLAGDMGYEFIEYVLPGEVK